ncbi:hypothetical protein [Maridesulfovibrio salexigens]|uniref:PilZ domain-containing protein n=1 Tax=Maridesulfovibrio salexigens (strain ATCC 14822 / DSM 2638 / NCIMB 8403 / VKM B-1763) TaxID=526222 RepID=C6BSI2_MARSD|nr:hypothetical protein [Maridesulfovibrio salexigens]ACS79658.1 hypothetical protein Desal_1596 [Maridesulfovibrio salexigens DSM 2638]
MAVDQEFLYKTLRGFGETGLPPQTVNMLIVVGFCLIAIVAAVLWYNNRELKKKLKVVPSSWITDKEQLDTIFETALVYRSKIDLSFHSTSEKRRTVACSIDDIADHLVLEMPANGNVGKSWLGREVTGFFHVPAKQAGMVIFYNFTSIITEVKTKGSQYFNLYVALPDHIEQTQKREFLRVSPPSRHYDYANIIPDTKQGLNAGLKFIATNGEYAPGHMGGKDSKVFLSDISGGGLSLELTHMTNKRAARFKLNKGHNFLVLLSLVDFGDKGIVRHLFVTKVRRIFIDPTQGRAQLGLSFESKFMGFDEDTKKPKWEKVDQNGCPEMDDWTYNLYLELYREGNE